MGFQNLTLCLALSLGIVACKGKSVDPCLAMPADDKTKPAILVIGDSISLGYTPYLKADLPAYSVIHSPCNDMSSSNAMAQLGLWLSYRPSYDVVVFNHGLWDIPAARGPGNSQAVPLDVYVANLRAEAMELKRHANRVIFVTSTEPGDAWTQFSMETVQAYNAAAVSALTGLVDIYDLHADSLALKAEHDASVVHFTPAGSAYLAEKIVTAIERSASLDPICRDAASPLIEIQNPRIGKARYLQPQIRCIENFLHWFV